MISRRSAIVLAELYARVFYSRERGYSYESHPWVDGITLKNFLYVRDYEPWLMNSVKALTSRSSQMLIDLIMDLQTGATVRKAVRDVDREQSLQIGHSILKSLAADMLAFLEDLDLSKVLGKRNTFLVDSLTSMLELDGYVFRNGRLYQTEANVIDQEVEEDELLRLYTEEEFGSKDELVEHLDFAAKHFEENNWIDCVVRARLALEVVMREVAAKHHHESHGKPIDPVSIDRAAKVRDYLQDKGVLNKVETEMVTKVYAFLSVSGPHPGTSGRDPARLCRNLALTLSQYAILRLKQSLSSAKELNETVENG